MNPTVEEMRERLDELQMDSGNYHGECGVCGVANKLMLTDAFCAMCRITALETELAVATVVRCELERQLAAAKAECERLTYEAAKWKDRAWKHGDERAV